MNTLATRLKETRLERGLTQKEVGDSVGITVQAISQLENGTTKGFKGAHLTIVAAKLGVNPHWLATGEGDMALQKNSEDLESLIKYWSLMSKETQDEFLGAARRYAGYDVKFKNHPLNEDEETSEKVETQRRPIS